MSFSLGSCRRKRESVIRTQTPSPHRLEKSHYPIFNPQDPRHNPAVASCSLTRGGYLSRSRGSRSSQGSVRWMQSLPRRSLRKARSGFFALRSEMKRRVNGRRDDIPGLWLQSNYSEGILCRGQRTLFPTSTTSVASTTADNEFGIDLYRIKCNCPSAIRLNTREYMLPISSSSSLTLFSPFSLPELDIDPSRYAGSNLDNALGIQISRMPSPSRQSVKWYDDNETSGDTETSDYFGSTGYGFVKENAPQIPNSGKVMEPLCLFETSQSDSDQDSKIDNYEDGNPVRALSLGYTVNVAVPADANGQEKLCNEQSKHPGVQGDLSAESLEVEADLHHKYLADCPSITLNPEFAEGSSLSQEIFGCFSDHSTCLDYFNDDRTSTKRTPLSLTRSSPVGNDKRSSSPFGDEVLVADDENDYSRLDSDSATKTEKRTAGDGSMHSCIGL